MHRIDITFITLQIIAVVQNLWNCAVLCRHGKKFIVRHERRLAWPHIREDHTAGLSAGMRPMTDLIPVRASSGLARLFDDAAANIIEPAVINTSEPAIFDPPIAEIGSAMGAMQAQ